MEDKCPACLHPTKLHRYWCTVPGCLCLLSGCEQPLSEIEKEKEMIKWFQKNI